MEISLCNLPLFPRAAILTLSHIFLANLSTTLFLQSAENLPSISGYFPSPHSASPLSALSQQLLPFFFLYPCIFPHPKANSSTRSRFIILHVFSGFSVAHFSLCKFLLCKSVCPETAEISSLLTINIFNKWSPILTTFSPFPPNHCLNPSNLTFPHNHMVTM